MLYIYHDLTNTDINSKWISYKEMTSMEMTYFLDLSLRTFKTNEFINLVH